jgi:hypothetical protein
MTTPNTDMPRIGQAYYAPITDASPTVSLNTVGTSPLVLLHPAAGRRKITFHNPNVPGNVNLLIAQTATPGFASPGGGFILFPGSNFIVDGDAAQGPWYVTAQSGSGNGVTALTSGQ